MIQRYNHETAPSGVSIPVPGNPDVFVSIILTPEQSDWFHREKQQLDNREHRTSNPAGRNLQIPGQADATIEAPIKNEPATNLPDPTYGLKRLKEAKEAIDRAWEKFYEKVFARVLKPEQIDEVNTRLPDLA
jgi:hypothetical protein